MSVNERERAKRGGTANKSCLSCGLKVVGLIIISIVVITITAPYMARFGFCQGWWLKLNPWAHYWWLCECGPEFERGLYPDNIEIVVSACRDPRTATLSPDGRYMIVRSWKNQSYILDLATDQEQPWPHFLPLNRHETIDFRTDTLVLIGKEKSEELKLVDIVDASVINLTTFKVVQRGNVFEVLPEALQAFRKANRILVKTGSSVAIALTDNSTGSPKGNYALYYPPQNFQNDSTAQLETLLLEHGIAYEKFGSCQPEIHQTFCASDDGRFLATGDAIFVPYGSANQRLTALPWEQLLSPSSERVGWAYDNSGVYLRLSSKYIQESGWITPPKYRIPGAIVKLKVPEAYR